MKSVVIRWINESETIPEMEINSCDVAIMLCIYQCQMTVLLISHGSGPVPVPNKRVIHLFLKVRDNMMEETKRGAIKNSHWSFTGFN